MISAMKIVAWLVGGLIIGLVELAAIAVISIAVLWLLLPFAAWLGQAALFFAVLGFWVWLFT
jgi:hypothetical protein